MFRLELLGAFGCNMLSRLVVCWGLDLVNRVAGPGGIDTFLYQHFWHAGRSPRGYLVQLVGRLSCDKSSSMKFSNINEFGTGYGWIKLLQTASPLGLRGGVCRGGGISRMPDFDVF